MKEAGPTDIRLKKLKRERRVQNEKTRGKRRKKEFTLERKGVTWIETKSHPL
jgi:hypothetical protein